MITRRFVLGWRHVVDKALSKMPRQDGQRIRHELDKLAENAERREVDIDTLTGRSGCRLRVGGMRIIFEHDDEARTIDVLRIVPRGEAYKQ